MLRVCTSVLLCFSLLLVAASSSGGDGGSQCTEKETSMNPRLTEVQEWMETRGSSRIALPPHLLAILVEGAWNRSTHALNLLMELDAKGAYSSEVLGTLGTSLARLGRLSEAEVAFERAAALPPASVLKHTKHRRHNLELIHGDANHARAEAEEGGTPSSSSGGGRGDGSGGDGSGGDGGSGGGASPQRREGDDGGWGDGSGRLDTGPSCEIDVRDNLTAVEFEESYVLAGRPVLVPLGAVIERCLDSGPWPCKEAGCPSDPLGCEGLAALGVCESTFEQVWDDPVQAGLNGATQVSANCRASCGACGEGVTAADSQLWTRAELVRRAGACIVPRVRTSGVVDHQYARTVGPSGAVTAGASHTTLGEFIQEAMPLQTASSGGHGAEATGATGDEGDGRYGGDLTKPAGDVDPPYIVATRPSRGAPTNTPIAQQERQCWRILDRSTRLAGLARLPRVFLPDDASHKRILFAGGTGSGTGFHDHSNTFSLLPFGRKSWMLLPPSASYELPGVGTRTSKLTPAEWQRLYEKSPKALPIPPLRCIQPAGSALFVPSGWKHATINIAPSVGVAVEVGDVDVIERAQRAAKQEQATE